MGLVFDYIFALQAALLAGATVCMSLERSWVNVVSIEVGSHWLEVGYITSAFPEEQFAPVPLSTVFRVVFDDYPKELIQMGWLR